MVDSICGTVREREREDDKRATWTFDEIDSVNCQPHHASLCKGVVEQYQVVTSQYIADSYYQHGCTDLSRGSQATGGKLRYSKQS
jgi:hypothetical protein